jgi:ATP-dependent DNA ligase
MTFESINQAIQERKFQPSKPIREIRPIDVQRNPEIIGSRKYNGNFATAVAREGQVGFYTASNLPLATLESRHWASIPNWMDAMRAIPQRSILLGEIHISSETIEDLGAFQEWYTWHINGLEGTSEPPPRAATFKAFDVLCWDGTSLGHLPYRERFFQIPELLRVEQAPYTRLKEASSAVEAARAKKIEGFVFWNANAKTYCKLSGENKARAGAWKVKPLYTEKFNLLGFVNPDPAKLIVRLGDRTMEFNCGSGLTSEQRREMLRRHAAGRKITVTVGHYGIDETGKPEIPAMHSYEDE